MINFSRMMLVFIFVLVSACAMLPTHKDDLNKKNDDFMLRVRWLDFPGAALHFDGEDRQDFIEQFEDVEDLKITSFTMARIDVDVPEEKVAIHYLLEYYILPSVTIKKKRFSLAWEQQPGGAPGTSYWRIVEPFPELL